MGLPPKAHPVLRCPPYRYTSKEGSKNGATVPQDRPTKGVTHHPDSASPTTFRGEMALTTGMRRQFIIACAAATVVNVAACDSLDLAAIDWDGDGVPDARDAFPVDPSEDTDSDGDGVGDNADAFPMDPARSDLADGDTDSDMGNENDNSPDDTSPPDTTPPPTDGGGRRKTPN